MLCNLDPQITNDLRESSRKYDKRRTRLTTLCEGLMFFLIIFIFYLAFCGTYAIEREWDKLVGGLK